MFRIGIGEYEVCCQANGFPDMQSGYQSRAMLHEDFTLEAEAVTSSCFVSVGRGMQWPTLVVTQQYAPAGGAFTPGLLLVPETHRLFIGAGCRLLGYDLLRSARLWEDEANAGFWSWTRHGSMVLMAAELELAAWDIHGRKRWSKFVEPPWDYTVIGEFVIVDVMGIVSRIHLEGGDQS